MLHADDECELPLPCIEVLVSGSLALMTACADPAVGARLDAAAQRVPLARKIVSNLRFLRRHPHICPEMRQVMCNVHGHWARMAAAGNACMPVDAVANNSTPTRSLH